RAHHEARAGLRRSCVRTDGEASLQVAFVNRHGALRRSEHGAQGLASRGVNGSPDLATEGGQRPRKVVAAADLGATHSGHTRQSVTALVAEPGRLEKERPSMTGSEYS